MIDSGASIGIGGPGLRIMGVPVARAYMIDIDAVLKGPRYRKPWPGRTHIHSAPRHRRGAQRGHNRATCCRWRV